VTSDARARLNALLSLFSRARLPLKVTSTDRSIAKQQALYLAGKTSLPGGKSLHNFGRAADVVPAGWATVREAGPHIRTAAGWLAIEAVIESDHVHLEFPF
jgi:hypothetical protein